MTSEEEQIVLVPVPQGMDIPVLPIKEEHAEVLQVLPLELHDGEIRGRASSSVARGTLMKRSSSFRENAYPFTPPQRTWTRPFHRIVETLQR